MTVQVRVVSATGAEIECDITVSDADGEALAVFDGFTVQSLGASARLSPERIDKGLYEIQWVAHAEQLDSEPVTDESSWLVLVGGSGVGPAVAEQLRRRGRRVHTVAHEADPRLEQLGEVLADQPGLAGIVDCWPLDIRDHAS